MPNPTGAPEAKVKPKDHDGQDWRFLPLCDFHVELQAIASDGQELDSSRDVTLKPRSDKWHVDYKADPGSPTPGQGTLQWGPLVMNNGMNRCAEQKSLAIANQECGWIHRSHDNPNDYSDYYTIKTVSDDGPFQGYAYVDSQKLRIARKVIISSAYLGGQIAADNRKAGNGANFERIHQQILAHEKMHGTLARTQVNAADPAQQLEPFIGEHEDGFEESGQCRAPDPGPAGERRVVGERGGRGDAGDGAMVRRGAHLPSGRGVPGRLRTALEAGLGPRRRLLRDFESGAAGR